MNDLISFNCLFDSSINVIVVYKTHRYYKTMQKCFKDCGHAFSIINDKVIVIDGEATKQDWFSKAHFLIIQAHETGHIKSQSSDELTADKIGLSLVKSLCDKETIALYKRLFETRYPE